MRGVNLLKTAVCLTVMMSSAAFSQKVRTSADASVGVGYSSSPFLQSGRNSSSPYLQAQIAPRIALVDERGESSVAGYVRGNAYLNNYNPTWALGVTARTVRTLSPRWSISGGASFDTSINGERGFSGYIEPAPIAPVDGTVEGPVVQAPIVPPIVIPTTDPSFGNPDITLLGRRQRYTSYGANFGASYAVSERDSLNAGVQIHRSDYGANGFDSTTFGGSLGYSRAISERTQIGLRGSVQHIDYATGGSGNVYQPQVTLSTSLSPTVNLSGGLGLLFTKTSTLVDRSTSTGISGNVSLCKAGNRSNLCFSASRDAGPTGLGTISKRFSTAATYSYRISEDDSVNASVNYSRVSNDRNLLGGSDFSYLSGSGTYSHQFTRRLGARATGSYRNPIGASFSRRSDYSLLLSFYTRLGSLQ